MTTRFLLLNGIAFLIGCAWHFHEIFAALGSAVIDRGDSLFNLWILRHFSANFDAFHFNNFWVTNIYWPENAQALFFSDLLLFPALIFHGIIKIAPNFLAAYNATALVLTIMGWYLYSVVFWKIRILAAEKTQISAAAADVLAIYFLYLAFFSVSRSYHYWHFQNLSSFWFLLAFVGVWRLFSGKNFGISMIAAAYLLLIVTVPYFAILTVIIGLLCGLLFLFSKGPLYLWQKSKADLALAALLFLTSLPIVAKYSRPASGDQPVFFHASGISRQDFFELFPHTPLHDFAQKHFTIHHGNIEAPAYLGFSLIVCFFIYFFLLRRNNSGTSFSGEYKDYAREILYFILCNIAVWMAALISGQLIYKLFLCGILWGFYIRLFYKTVLAIRAHRDSYYIPLLLFLTITIYALAFGAAYEDKFSRFDPSIAGFFAQFIPGFHKLRAIGRYVHFGYVFLMALFLFGIIRTWKPGWRQKSPILFGALILFAGLQVFETKTGIPAQHISRAELEPNPEERQVLGSLHGTGFTLPSKHWEESVYPMNYFVGYPGIKLVNGYSGGITRLFEAILEAGKTSIPWHILDEHKIDYIFVLKYRLEKPAAEKIVTAALQKDWGLLFESDKLAVISRKPRKV
jgi:hypothetical protein